jgi:hypothetical protein
MSIQNVRAGEERRLTEFLSGSQLSTSAKP